MNSLSRKWRVVSAAVVVAGLCSSMPARAEDMGHSPFLMPAPGPMTMGEGPPMMLPLIFRSADLPPEQREKVKQIMKTDRAALHDLFRQLETANSQLADRLFAGGNVQPADLTTQVSHITDLRRQLMERGVKTALAIRAVLTPEQLSKVTALKARMDKVRSEMRDIFVESDD